MRVRIMAVALLGRIVSGVLWFAQTYYGRLCAAAVTDPHGQATSQGWHSEVEE